MADSPIVISKKPQRNDCITTPFTTHQLKKPKQKKSKLRIPYSSCTPPPPISKLSEFSSTYQNPKYLHIFCFLFERYTYGCEVYQAFNEKIHDPARKVVNSEGQAKCKEVFSVHVKKDTVVKFGDYQCKKEYTPFMGDKAVLTFDMYASESEDPKYITEPGCMHLGKLSITLPEGTTKDEKKICLALKFGATSLQATATAVKTGKSVTSSFDLLS